MKSYLCVRHYIAGSVIRNRTAFENARKITTVLFDKTGTLTHGTFEVSGILSHAEGWDENRIVSVAAALESRSEHPIARGSGGKGRRHPGLSFGGGCFGRIRRTFRHYTTGVAPGRRGIDVISEFVNSARIGETEKPPRAVLQKLLDHLVNGVCKSEWGVLRFVRRDKIRTLTEWSAGVQPRMPLPLSNKEILSAESTGILQGGLRCVVNDCGASGVRCAFVFPAAETPDCCKLSSKRENRGG